MKNRRLRRLFIPAYNYNDRSKRFIIYQVALKVDGTLDTSKLTSGANEYYTQTYASVSLTGSTLVPYFPGFAVRMDTGSLVLVDEQLARIMVWTCSNYSSSTGALSMVQVSVQYTLS